MVPSITLEDAQANLPQLIQDMPNGSRVEVTCHGVTVATITREPGWPSEPGSPKAESEKPRRVLGAQRGSVLYMAPDFDEPLDDFKEYM